MYVIFISILGLVLTCVIRVRLFFQLSSVGVNFDEEIRALLILCSFPERWNGLVMDVSNFISGSNTLKSDDVIGVNLSKETWRKGSSEYIRKCFECTK